MTFAFFRRNRRLFAGAALAMLLQSLAWGAGAAGFADVLESENASAVHEQGCLEDPAAPNGQQEADSHCNEACHFWSQFQVVCSTGVAAVAASSPILRPNVSVYVFENRSTPPFRPPRISLPV